MLTIDRVRSLAKLHGSVPTYNGIGMIRLRLGGRACLFYSELSESINNTIHDHRYNYISHVVKGTIRNHVYSYKKVDHKTHFTHVQKEMVTKPDMSRGTIRHKTPNIEITKVCSFDTTERRNYFMHYKSFHYVEPQTPKLITILIPGLRPWMRTANFIVDDRIELVSPFSRPKSEKRCWEIIEYTIND